MNAAPCNPDIYGQLASDRQFSTLVEVIKMSGLRNAVSSTFDITMFAPTNNAFDKIPKKTLQGLMGNPESLMRILQYHIIEQRLPYNKIEPGREISLDTLYRAKKISLYRHSNGEVEVNRFNKILGRETYALNGIIYPIDGVLFPM
jgi:uncharacterized surface protein with fasciclin (FAS1) repeats